MAGLQDLVGQYSGHGLSGPELNRILGDLMRSATAPIKAPGEETGLYWDARHPSRGGTQRVGSSVGAPSADHYRLVDSLEEAQSIFDRGEKPLMVGNLRDINPDEIDPTVLRKLQEDQWAAPGGTPLFSDAGITGAPGSQALMPGLPGLIRR